MALFSDELHKKVGVRETPPHVAAVGTLTAHEEHSQTIAVGKALERVVYGVGQQTAFTVVVAMPALSRKKKQGKNIVHISFYIYVYVYTEYTPECILSTTYIIAGVQCHGRTGATMLCTAVVAFLRFVTVLEEP